MTIKTYQDAPFLSTTEKGAEVRVDVLALIDGDWVVNTTHFVTWDGARYLAQKEWDEVGEFDTYGTELRGVYKCLRTGDRLYPINRVVGEPDDPEIGSYLHVAYNFSRDVADEWNAVEVPFIGPRQRQLVQEAP